MINFTKCCVLFMSIFLIQNVQAQDADSLMNLSLEELMNIPIQSASKKKETLFDAPLSSYTISAAEIERSGANSIPEALRLAPGVIVREQTNGVYDVSIRGLDNLTRGDVSYSSSSLSLLVMIDNRPIFNNNLGGTFWETLPVEVSDVERIEVVRGPSAPLFGPNAVTGVINIITKRTTAVRSQAVVRAVAGSPSSPITSAFFGTKLSDKLDFNVSANYQTRQRGSDSDNLLNPGSLPLQFGPTSSLPAPVKGLFPDVNQSVRRFGVNTFIGYNPSEKVQLDFSAGYQNSGSQKSFLANSASNLGWNEAYSGYANFAARIHGLSVRTSLWSGYEDLSYKAPPGRYDFKVFDFMAEYEIKIGKLGSIVPGVSYMSANFDDSKYQSPTETTFFAGKSQDIRTLSGFVRTDWNFTEKWRVIAAARLDKFSVPDASYIAYEFASTYSLNEANLVRAAVTRSNSGSFVGNNYVDFTGVVAILGNQNTKLFVVNMIEVGYRTKLSDRFQIDLDVFQQKGSNVVAYMVSGFQSPAPGVVVPSLIQLQGTPIESTQQGFTLSFNYILNQRVQFKPFITYQSTETKNFPDQYVLPSLAPVTYSTISHKAAPAFFGGWYFNYNQEKWNVNISGYYMGEQEKYAGNLSFPAPPVPVDTNPSKFLLNAQVGYNLTKSLSAFATGRNLLNQTGREFGYTDKIGSFYGFGLNLNFSKN